MSWLKFSKLEGGGWCLQVKVNKLASIVYIKKEIASLICRPPARVLKPEGFDKNTPYRPVIGMNANRTSFAQVSDAGRRMLK